MNKERCPDCTHDVEMMVFTIKACPMCRIATPQQKLIITKEEAGTILYVILAGRPYTAHQFRDYRDTLMNWLQSKGLSPGS